MLTVGREIRVIIREHLPGLRRIASESWGRLRDTFPTESGVVSHGAVSGLPTALASPFIPRLVLIPERVAYRPDMVIERHMGLAGIDSRAWQPFDIREHIRLVYELSHFRCPVCTLYGRVIFCPEPRIDMVVYKPLCVLFELPEWFDVPALIQKL